MAASPIPVHIHHLVHEATLAQATVILRSADDRQLPLTIGLCEWQAINGVFPASHFPGR